MGSRPGTKGGPMRLSRKPHVIPPEELALPVGFSLDGKRMISLREAWQDPSANLSFVEMTPDQRARLTAKRMSLQKRRPAGIMGIGWLSPKRAVAEVLADTEIGRALVDVEGRTVASLLRIGPRSSTLIESRHRKDTANHRAS